MTLFFSGDTKAAQKASGMLDDDLNKEVLDKIKSRMKELFVQLDTLTHYHYTPTPINAEVILILFKALCSRNFQNVKLRLDFVEIL